MLSVRPAEALRLPHRPAAEELVQQLRQLSPRYNEATIDEVQGYAPNSSPQS